MDIKNFIKKQLKKKDNTRFLVRYGSIEFRWSSLTTLSKYIKNNKEKVKSIHINLI